MLLLFLLFAGASDAVVDPISTRIEKGIDSDGAVILRLSFLAAIAIAAADVGRLQLGPALSVELRWAAVLVLCLGWLLRIAAYAVNDFFANVIVLQPDRGHSVVDRGPYRWVRHPAYAGFLVMMPAMAIAMGSLLALPFALLVSFLLLRRTQLEDRFLREQLQGYAEYAAKVRYRLIPGLY